MLTVLLLAAILAFLRIIKLLNDQLKQGAALSKEAVERALKEKLVAEEPTQAAFFGALRDGLETSDDNTVVGIPLSASELGARESKEQEAHRLQVFFNSVPGQIAAIRAQLSKINAAPDNVRTESLRELYRRVDIIKQKSGMSALRPVGWRPAAWRADPTAHDEVNQRQCLRFANHHGRRGPAESPVCSRIGSRPGHEDTGRAFGCG